MTEQQQRWMKQIILAGIEKMNSRVAPYTLQYTCMYVCIYEGR